MRALAIGITLLTLLTTSAQTPQDDEVRFQSAIDWLDNKLNYIYYDESRQQWWTNTFYVNEKKEITLKHIASKRPNTANIRNKTYTIRTFQIGDINPANLKISKVEKTKGRIVKGKMLELRTFGFQNLIHKSINGQQASSTSFLYLSFPSVLEDSISNFAEIVKEKFEEAILASSRLYPTGDKSDIENIFSCLAGEFTSQNDENWTANLAKPSILKIENMEDIIQYLGYNNLKEQFYLLEITSSGPKTHYFKLNRNDELSLQADSTEVFTFHTLNAFTFKGQTYFRK